MPALTFDDLVEQAPSGGGVRTIPAQDGRPARVVMDMSGSQQQSTGPLTFDDLMPESGLDKAGRYAEDFARSTVSGLDKGVTGLVGLPADLVRGTIWLGNELQSAYEGRPYDEVSAEFDKSFPSVRPTLEKFGGHALHEASPLAYTPKTGAGKTAENVASFLPGGAIGRLANIGRNVAAFGLVPGIVSEGAGRLFEGTSAEGPARFAGAFAGGLGSAGAMRMGSSGRLVQTAGKGVTAAELDAAEQLFQQARQHGVDISRAEALQAVTQGRTGMGDLQHTVEGMGGMREFYAGRPAQNEAAARQAFGGIAPQAADPSQLGPAAGEAAGQFMRQTPEANILADVLWRAGPRTTPEQAGSVIQSELGRVHQGREGMRAALAESDYGAARNAPATIPLNGGHRVADATSHYDWPSAYPVYRDPKTGQMRRMTPEQEAAANLVRPEPIWPVVRGDGGRMRRLTDEEIATEQARRWSVIEQGRAENQALYNVTEPRIILGERATEFGQVDASAVLRRLDGALDTAKGAVRQGLQAARSALFKPDGTLDMSVAGLHNSRQAIDDLISQAQRAGANQTVMRLQEAKRSLDQAMEQVPAYGQARTNFQAASRPLEPFDQSRAPGKIIERDEFNSRYVMPPERVPGAIQNNGVSAARDFNAVATPAAREAFEQSIVTQVLDRATREGADLSSQSIRQALRQNEDLLRQYPGVRDKLESIAIARDGLAKIEGTPIGKIAARDIKTRDAINALFPANPLPNSQVEIGQAVSALSARSPMVARQLVRTHAEMTFNEAAQRLASSGPAQGGGAKFAAIIRGNQQQAANLEAAVRALPNGNQVWPGFNRFLEVMEAQQFRQATGSRTAFKGPAVDQLKGGGLVRSGAEAVSTAGFSIPKKVMKKFDDWSVGRNLDELANVLTNPDAASTFRSMATAPRGSAKAAALTTRLGYLAISSQRSASGRHSGDS